ncbi:DUF6090 family protein [Portibacter marinus]|uniref:DUF6090 family protein n=1 Tax=Portibacter marinus TaxID=2898660 RepID=UPI001F318CC8|nr:DUF6090 family protein [Portibacter marinus]
MSENKTGKYLKYAIGEIILVVIGILIALQINNWNETLKNKEREREILQDIKTSLQSDLELYDKVFNGRFETKRIGLEFLKKAAYANQNHSKDTLMRYVRMIQLDIQFRYERGPFDALKSAGFELIKDKEMRKKIITTYESYLPGYSLFINNYNDDRVTLGQKFQQDILKEVLIKEEEGRLDIVARIKVDNLLQHPSFISLLALEQDKYENYMDRMADVKNQMNVLIAELNGLIVDD